jgi:hypothetical protein
VKICYKTLILSGFAGGWQSQKSRESASAGLKMRGKGILKRGCRAIDVRVDIGIYFLLRECKDTIFFFDTNAKMF